MKKLVSVLLVVCLMAGFTVCVAAAPEKIRLTDHFSVDMTPSELLEKAEAIGLELIRPDDDDDFGIDFGDEGPVRDGRRYQALDISFYYKFDGLLAYFTPSGEFDNFHVTGDRFETAEGIRVGDSRAKVMKTYWKNMVTIFGVFAGAKTKSGFLGFSFNEKNELEFWGCQKKVYGDYQAEPVFVPYLPPPFSTFFHYVCFGWLWDWAMTQLNRVSLWIYNAKT